MFRFLSIICLGLTLIAPLQAFAQDEIIVTASRVDNSIPGIFLEKRGDFLLLEARVENDSRELSTRLKEIKATLDKFKAAAENNPDITLGIVDESDFVRPLSESNFSDSISYGSRPDTSVATLKVKTEIPENVIDSYKLAQMLSEFVDSIEEEDRTKITTYDEISVSVVDPFQYRVQVIKQVVNEVNMVTDGLGPEYRAIITGIDKELKWVRSGDLNLAFYLPYEYEIIPDTLHSIQRVVED